MRMSAINIIPTKPPPAIPATTHQNETIWSPPSTGLATRPVDAGPIPGLTAGHAAFGGPSDPSKPFMIFESSPRGSVLPAFRIGWTKRLKKARCEPGHELPPQPPNLTLFYKLIPLSLSLRPCRPVSYKYRPLSRGFKKLSQRSQQFRRVVAAGQQASSRDLDTARKVPAQGAACAGRGSARCGSQCLQRHFILISLRKDYISEHAFAHGSHCAL